MKICLIDNNKSEEYLEIEPSDEIDNPSILKVTDCFKVDSEGNKIPIFINRMGNESTMKLCDYIYAKYKK